MALTAKKRRIIIKKSGKEIELAEPFPNATIEEIRAYNQGEHAELATCGVDADEFLITFKPQAGTRG